MYAVIRFLSYHPQFIHLASFPIISLPSRTSERCCHPAKLASCLDIEGQRIKVGFGELQVRLSRGALDVIGRDKRTYRELSQRHRRDEQLERQRFLFDLSQSYEDVGVEEATRFASVRRGQTRGSRMLSRSARSEGMSMAGIFLRRSMSTSAGMQDLA